VDSAIATLTSDLATETAARIADVDAEETRALAAEAALAADFANIYTQKVAVAGTPNGTLTTFTLLVPVRIGSEMIHVNGILMEEGEDYTTVITNGKVSAIEFFIAPITEMKVRAYGVCSAFYE
jgi:Tfp pilus assembly pilus retraction ATPase PilT